MEREFNKTQVFTLAAFTVLAVGAFFMANVKLPPWSHVVSAINVVVFALPTLWAMKMWLGWRDGSILAAVLGLYALIIEASAIITGFPYGHFGYSDHLGFKLFGLVPWTVAFAWTPLILGAYSVAANLFEKRIPRIAATTILLTSFDVALDPGAVMLGFWKYADGGAFYGVPLSNFLGWLVSGLLGSILLDGLVAIFKPLLPTPVQLSISTIFIIFFWLAIAVFGGMTAPALIGAAILFGLVWVYRKNHYPFDDMIVFVDEKNVPIATGRKLVSHNADTKLHRAFSIFLFNSKGELLLQQRALSKKTWPGVWSNSCCGHVMLHEMVEKAAARRLRYELGLSGIELKMALPNFSYRAERDGIVENEICPVLIGFTDREPHINPNEVEAIRWVDWHEFVRSLDDPNTEISPWAIQEVKLLADSLVFRDEFAARTSKAAMQ
ncbi:MAG: isopentenyl-diphosphate Delta-isomerase [Blastocatellia bacterium]